PVSRASTSRRAGRSRSRSTARKAPSEMGTPSAIGEAQSYPSQLFALASRSAAQLVGPPTAPHRREAMRRLTRQSLWLLAIGAVLIVVLMFGVDAVEIS